METEEDNNPEENVVMDDPPIIDSEEQEESDVNPMENKITNTESTCRDDFENNRGLWTWTDFNKISYKLIINSYGFPWFITDGSTSHNGSKGAEEIEDSQKEEPPVEKGEIDASFEKKGLLTMKIYIIKKDA